jgi:hypothetical protein
MADQQVQHRVLKNVERTIARWAMQHAAAIVRHWFRLEKGTKVSEMPEPGKVKWRAAESPEPWPETRPPHPSRTLFQFFIGSSSFVGFGCADKGAIIRKMTASPFT